MFAVAECYKQAIVVSLLLTTPDDDGGRGHVLSTVDRSAFTCVYTARWAIGRDRARRAYPSVSSESCLALSAVTTSRHPFLSRIPVETLNFYTGGTVKVAVGSP